VQEPCDDFDDGFETLLTFFCHYQNLRHGAFMFGANQCRSNTLRSM